MIKIGILDDEAIWRNKIKNTVISYFQKQELDYEILEIDKSSCLVDNSDLNLLFLDIELSETLNGLEVATELFQRGYECEICFLTSHGEFAREGYRVNAFRYIDKLHLDEIEEALDSYINRYVQEKKIKCVEEGGLEIYIALKDIIAIETYNRKIRYIMVDGGNYICNGKISEIGQQLSEYGFYQVQRSYIVNMSYIVEQNSKGVMLKNQLFVTVGRGQRSDFKKQFFEWRRNH